MTWHYERSRNNRYRGGHCWQGGGTGFSLAGVAALHPVLRLAFLDRRILSLLVQPISAEFGFTDTELGLLQRLAFASFFVVCSIPIGWIVDRGSRRVVIFAGVLIWSMMTVSCGLAQGFRTHSAAKLGVGFGAGEACILPAVMSMIADVFPLPRRALATSLFTSGAGMTAGRSLLLGGVLIGALIRLGPVHVTGLGLLPPKCEAFLILGIPGLLLAFLQFTIREPARHEKSGCRRDQVPGGPARAVGVPCLPFHRLDPAGGAVPPQTPR